MEANAGTEVVSAEALVRAMRDLAAAPEIAEKERKKRQALVANWERRLMAEDRRAAETAQRVKALRDRAETAERDVCVLLEKLRKWKAFFEQAMLARSTVDHLRTMKIEVVQEALLEAEVVARARAEARQRRLNLGQGEEGPE
jgi:hypothetical protein